MRLSLFKALRLAAVVSFFTIAGFAQLMPCPIAATGYKVWIDDISVQSPSAQSWSPVVSYALKSMLEGLGHSAGSAPPHLRVSVLTCTGRHPSSLGLFSDQVLRAQNTESVVLELWADMLAVGSATRLSFSYVLVPVLVSSHNEGGRFSHTNLVTPQNPDEVLALLRRKKTIEAYYDIAIGAKLFAENQWSLAPTYLCKGAALMQNSPDDADLVKYSRALAIDAAQKAASSQNGDNIYQLRGGNSHPCEATRR